jgi:predicted enzyme related to lactoylglutathione lyase
MAKVLGVGGVFFKSPDPELLYSWYSEHLGISKSDESGVSFQNSEQSPAGYLVWSAFDENTKYFDPADKQYMFNLVVDDLEGALQQVEKGGAKLIGEIESYNFGSFGWFVDPDGNKVELWQPQFLEQAADD